MSILYIARHYEYDHYGFEKFLSVGDLNGLLSFYYKDERTIVLDFEDHKELADKGYSHIFIELIPEEDIHYE